LSEKTKLHQSRAQIRLWGNKFDFFHPPKQKPSHEAGFENSYLVVVTFVVFVGFLVFGLWTLGLTVGVVIRGVVTTGVWYSKPLNTDFSVAGDAADLVLNTSAPARTCQQTSPREIPGGIFSRILTNGTF